jgi:hypothetical protein
MRRDRRDLATAHAAFAELATLPEDGDQPVEFCVPVRHAAVPRRVRRPVAVELTNPLLDERDDVLQRGLVEGSGRGLVGGAHALNIRVARAISKRPAELARVGRRQQAICDPPPAAYRVLRSEHFFCAQGGSSRAGGDYHFQWHRRLAEPGHARQPSLGDDGGCR